MKNKNENCIHLNTYNGYIGCNWDQFINWQFGKPSSFPAIEIQLDEKLYNKLVSVNGILVWSGQMKNVILNSCYIHYLKQNHNEDFLHIPFADHLNDPEYMPHALKKSFKSLKQEFKKLSKIMDELSEQFSNDD